MILFFDTLALAKFFHNEEGTEAVTDLLNSQENEPWFVSADENLCRVAGYIGARVFNPLKKGK